jgi:hypothetical protein
LNWAKSSFPEDPEPDPVPEFDPGGPPEQAARTALTTQSEAIVTNRRVDLMAPTLLD